MLTLLLNIKEIRNLEDLRVNNTLTILKITMMSVTQVTGKGTTMIGMDLMSKIMNKSLIKITSLFMTSDKTKLIRKNLIPRMISTRSRGK